MSTNLSAKKKIFLLTPSYIYHLNLLEDTLIDFNLQGSELYKAHIKNKNSVFLVVGPLRFYPPYTNGLVVHATFFLFIFNSYKSLKRILTIFFSLQFLG